MRERSLDCVDVGNWNELVKYYSLFEDLSDEAREFLQPRKAKFMQLLSNVINNNRK